MSVTITSTTGGLWHPEQLSMISQIKKMIAFNHSIILQDLHHQKEISPSITIREGSREQSAALAGTSTILMSIPIKTPNVIAFLYVQGMGFAYVPYGNQWPRKEVPCPLVNLRVLLKFRQLKKMKPKLWMYQQSWYVLSPNSNWIIFVNPPCSFWFSRGRIICRLQRIK